MSCLDFFSTIDLEDKFTSHAENVGSGFQILMLSCFQIADKSKSRKVMTVFEKADKMVMRQCPWFIMFQYLKPFYEVINNHTLLKPKQKS